MTKAECIIGDLGFVRRPEFDREEEKHNGSCYTVRVWELEKAGKKYAFHCDNYYGRSILFVDGKKAGDYEAIYEDIPRAIS